MTAATLYTDLQTELSDARSMATTLVTLRSSGHLAAHELETATHAVCLATAVAFERFIRDLFFECVNGTSGLAGVSSRLPKLDPESVNDVVNGGRQFLTWIPVKDTLERSQLFLERGQPFVRLWGRTTINDQLTRLHTVRNRIAHSGEQALAQYEKQISRGQAAFKVPARWLLAKEGPVTNLESILDAMTASAAALVAPDRTPTGVGPTMVESNTTAPPGMWTCTKCSRVRHTATWEKLGPCPRCSTTTECPHCGAKKTTPTRWELTRLRAV